MYYILLGEGLRTAIVNQKNTFRITTNEAGLIVKGVLQVTIIPSPLDPSEDPYFSGANVEVLDLDNGHYQTTYAIYEEGRYSLSVVCDGSHVSGSPYVLDCIQAPDAGLVRVYGTAFSRDALLVVGKPIDFSVDTTQAGHGQLKVLAEKPDGSKAQVFIAEDAEQNVFNVKIDATHKGVHTINVLWASIPIPESPFILQIADPSKVSLLIGV